MGGGRSGISPEAKAEAKLFKDMKSRAVDIKDMEYEVLQCFEDDGNYLFRTTDYEKNSVGYGGHDFMTEVANNNIVHNHPGGGCFSGEDLMMARGLHWIWAVTSDRIQMFRWNHNAYSDGYDKWSRKMQSFIMKVNENHENGTWVKAARQEWDKAHPLDYNVDQATFDKQMEERAKGIKELAHQKQREFFKNNQKEYGYTFRVRSWK